MTLRRTEVAALVALTTIVAACGQPDGSTPPASTPPTMSPSMPGMNMGGSPSPSPSAGAAGAMPGMSGGSGLMVDKPVPTEGAVAATETTGLQPLPFTLDGRTKVFELTAKPVFWKINADTQVTALTYNGTVPGPLIRVAEGDRIRIVFTNKLTTPTSIHWHGQFVPSNMDGVAQPEPGGLLMVVNVEP